MTVAEQQFEELGRHGIVSQLPRLLKSRHWAQRLTLFSREAARSMLLGNMRSRFRGRGMEFEEVRRYQPGDDIRTIDWKVSARAEGTYTKLFREERERPCHILVDQRSSMFFGSTTQFKSVLAAETATAIAWAALAGGDRVGGQVISDREERDSRSRRSKQAVLRLIHDINELNQALVTPVSDSSRIDSSLSNALEECRRTTRPGTAIFIISDFHDFNESAAKALNNLGKHTDVTLLHVFDPMELDLPVLGNVSVSNGEDVSRVTVSRRLAEDYNDRVLQQQTLLKSAVVQARTMYTRITTAESARQQLSRLLGR